MQRKDGEMVDEKTLRALVTYPESETLDFKQEGYRLDDEYHCSNFIKDILCLANTPRECSSYIIFGVRAHPNGQNDLIGLQAHPDDADLQQKFAIAKVEPRPRFTYYPVRLDNKSFGVIEIPLQDEGPYIAYKEIRKVKPRELYYRDGTRNSVADSQKTKELYGWFKTDASKLVLSMPAELVAGDDWDEFYIACRRFNHGHIYVFIIGPRAGDTDDGLERYFGRLPASVVLDFDPQTEVRGVFSVASGELKAARSVHLLTLSDRYSYLPDKASYWFAARGIEGRVSSLVESDWNAWNRRYARSIDDLMSTLARGSDGRPITIVSLWNATQYVRTICEIGDKFLGEQASYVFAVPEAERFAEVAEMVAGTTVSIQFNSVMAGISQHLASNRETIGHEVGLPHRDKSMRFLAPSDLQWLREDVDLLHSRIELDSASLGDDSNTFLKGAPISWSELSRHADADRDKTQSVLKRVKDDLELRSASRHNLYHWPGAGGTTLARRVAWELHNDYPVVLLRRVSPGETIGRLRELFNITQLPVFAIVEGAEAIPDTLEQLYSEVKAEQIPAVFLSVLRRFELQRPSDRSIYLANKLSGMEAFRFAECYKRVAPSKTDQLDDLLGSVPAKDQTPFMFALVTFGREFAGIESYIETRRSVATRQQLEILTYLGMAFYYGHRDVVSQLFSVYLGKPEKSTLAFESVFGDPQLELLIKTGPLRWRPIHQVIAEELIKSELAGATADRELWKANLSTWAVKFIKLCSGASLRPNDDTIDLVRRMFILRDEHDLLGTEASASSHFSQLIEDIPTKEGRLVVLRELAESFPDQPHFWGHLSRYYSYVMEEPTLALGSVRRAIEISQNDPVLYHIEGMCYRKMAYESMASIRREDAPTDDSVLRDIVVNAKKSFATAREIDASKEHAYISPAQLLLRVLDFGYYRSGCKTHAEFLTARTASWYRDQLDDVEDLIDQVRSLREGDRDSQYVENCQASLDELYDDYSSAIEGWNNLLQRGDVFAPPVRRQVARAYLTRRGRKWSSLPTREIDQIVELMEQNMLEEPASDNNMRIWFRAYRYTTHQDLDRAIDKIATLRTLGDSPESYFYLYVLHALKAIDGSVVERTRTRDLVRQSSSRSRTLRNRTRSFEWLGHGSGLGRLIHSSELGGWDDEAGFYGNVETLRRVEGRVVDAEKPEAGKIELSSSGLLAFFVPARVGARKGRDENRLVTFYLGFSYDGLRAWSVEFLNES